MDFADEVVVDLDAVRALDTAGVCVLIWAHHAAVEWGSVYRVVNAHGQVHRALLATGMQAVLADSEDIGALLLALLALPPASIQD
jgi:anti-anti-sigma regulatory factor